MHMAEESTIRCQSCGCDVPEDDCLISEGNTLCEDCYMDAGQRIKVCDPWGERSKLIFRESHGLTGTEGLTDLQKRIYEFIKARGKATERIWKKSSGSNPGSLRTSLPYSDTASS